jgi:hypothetical protein
MIIGRMNDEKGADEIMNQIMIERGIVPENPGHVLFSMKGFLRDSSVLVASLKNGPYQKMALVPPSPWLDDDAPAAAKIQTTVSNDTLLVTWSHDKSDDVFRWVVYYQYDALWEYTIMNRSNRSTALPLSRILREITRSRRQEVVKDTTQFLGRIAVSAVDRTGNESELTFQDVAPKIPPAMKQ